MCEQCSCPWSQGYQIIPRLLCSEEQVYPEPEDCREKRCCQTPEDTKINRELTCRISVVTLFKWPVFSKNAPLKPLTHFLSYKKLSLMTLWSMGTQTSPRTCICLTGNGMLGCFLGMCVLPGSKMKLWRISTSSILSHPSSVAIDSAMCLPAELHLAVPRRL